MSISATLATALSGLTVAARGAELASSNIANALNETYARRDLELTQGAGLGVGVAGITRHSDPALLHDRRMADGSAADREVKAGFLTQLDTVFGAPDAEGSLLARVAAFDAALLAATSRPDATVRLESVLDTAKALVAQIGDSAAMVQQARMRADGQIAAQVAAVNGHLAQVSELNSAIRTHGATGRDTSGLLDQRQKLIDDIALVIPLREIARPQGQLALYTASGAMLLDGRAAELAFAPVHTVTPDMTLASGALSDVTIDGRPLRVSGGTLAGQFALRDALAPAAQAGLDALARDLVERFSDTGVDSTLGPGAPGLFTDAGSALLPTAVPGLAQRLAVNAQVDPSQGGAVRRLRDGMAAAAGPVGDSALLGRLHAALLAPRAGPGASGLRSFAERAAELTTATAAARVAAESEASFASARAQELTVLHLQNGVDTDQEMQRLLVIEQAYAANARVMQAADDMLNVLLGL